MAADTVKVCAYCKNAAIPGQRLCRKCLEELSRQEDGPKESGGQADELGETTWDSGEAG